MSTAADDEVVVKQHRTNKSLTLLEKAAVIAEVEQGGRQLKEIASDYGISYSTLWRLVKDKKRILHFGETSTNKDRKRVKQTRIPLIEVCVLRWLKQAREDKQLITGPIIKDKAKVFAARMGEHQFKASSGWLEKFKTRNHILLDHARVGGTSLDESNLVVEGAARVGRRELTDDEIIAIARVKACTASPSSSSSSSSTEDGSSVVPDVSTSEALDSVQILRRYFQGRSGVRKRIFKALNELENYILDQFSKDILEPVEYPIE